MQFAQPSDKGHKSEKSSWDQHKLFYFTGDEVINIDGGDVLSCIDELCNFSDNVGIVETMSHV